MPQCHERPRTGARFLAQFMFQLFNGRSMLRLLLFSFAIVFTACSHNQTANEYWCSYEATQSAYQTCIEVADSVDDDTANAAGKHSEPDTTNNKRQLKR